MTNIRKVVVKSFGDESKLEVVNADIAPPGAREVQVAVDYASFGGADVNMRKGRYPFQRQAPFTPGYSLLGTVVANGEGASRFAAGTRVACLTVYDAQAERANVPEAFVIPVPAAVASWDSRPTPTADEHSPTRQPMKGWFRVAADKCAP